MALLQSLRSRSSPLLRSAVGQVRLFASKPEKLDLQSSDVTLQKARTWDEGLADGFATSSMADVFKGKKVVIFGVPGAFTGVCTNSHVPSYLKNADAFKAKGADKVVCVAVNDPYTMKGWSKGLDPEGKLEFYGDFDGKFHKMLGLSKDLSGALMGMRGERWSALVDDGEVKLWNVETVPSNFEVSSGDYMVKQLE
eukprot:TRINITY_DN24396_c0_g1_i1.p1 TRINITY_DN24396_c0_g1~~TRINITY_DN24396_c0_g1_i1.p1  ORF type:complete len:196 (+),score=42.30 TRINITY_DN24396_c0_g1_i1:164-751(+)